MNFKNKIRTIKDFPEKGILFRDITTILQDGNLLSKAIDTMIAKIVKLDFDIIVGPESRGFIFGVPIAYKLNKGFVPARKKGKLPFNTIGKEYDLEYGTNIIEIHKDCLNLGNRVVIIDDLLATGGTCKAICDLIKQLGGEIISMLFFIELENLRGRKTLENYNIKSIVKY